MDAGSGCLSYAHTYEDSAEAGGAGRRARAGGAADGDDDGDAWRAREPHGRRPPARVAIDGCLTTEPIERPGSDRGGQRARRADGLPNGAGGGGQRRGAGGDWWRAAGGEAAGVRVAGTYYDEASDAVGRFELRLRQPAPPGGWGAPGSAATGGSGAAKPPEREAAEGAEQRAALEWHQLLRDPSTGGGPAARRQSLGGLLGLVGFRTLISGLFVALACALAALLLLLLALFTGASGEAAGGGGGGIAAVREGGAAGGEPNGLAVGEAR